MVNPWKTYVKLSAVLAGSHGLTKGSLAFLNYPAQIMFKSTKVLPVMVMGAFIPGLRRKYPFHEYISALLLVVGLIFFTLADANTSPNFSIIGVIMISGALIMDSFLGNLQEAIFTMNPATTQMEMLFCSTVVGMPFLLLPMIFTGELFRAWSSCYQHPYVYGVLVFEAMATFVGQVSVLSLIALFGAATTAMITTARKAVTLLLSYIIFTKPMTEQHGTGLLLISMGIILKMLPDNKPQTRSASSKHLKSFTNEGKSLVENGEDDEKRPLLFNPGATGIMRGTKRFASSESVEDTNDTVVNNKRILAGSLFDVHRAEPSQQKSLAAPVLDVQRAELSRQHVRALNTQFASWVQTQLINHPDELWEDGVRDYVLHASNIMDEFRDIVSWLKANVAKAGTLTASESLTSGEKLVAETTNKETTLVKEKSGYTPVSSNASFTASWSSGVFSSSQSSGPSSNSHSAGSFSNSQSSGMFSNSKSSGFFPNNQSFGLFSNNQSSGGFSNSQSSGLLSNGQISGGFSNTQSTGLFSNSQSSGLFSNNQSFGLSSSNNNQSSAASSSTQSSGLFSFSQSSGVFSNSGSSTALFNSQTPVSFGSTSSVPINTNASDDGEDENDLQRPSSPSVKKAEEKGIVVVHEVKCKLYVKVFLSEKFVSSSYRYINYCFLWL
ncbi:hypothetical protein HS088_TW15G00334 [Tripterygium wilfordii]|uniref:Uncharacterized protein n=1 Tax=Tripterygium wilfordii TaxID=458696 RepID=A0A7J7CLC2_TRIWF|nr:hypothetical protein HS088_TW15G00334 [Tripterygium wilfordii]